MRSSKQCLGALLLSLMAGAAGAAGVNCELFPAKASNTRYAVVISDLHFGLGREPGGAWNPKEDFRWSRALGGFLAALSECTHDAADLILAGDTLELWQPPSADACPGPSAGLGCTERELGAIVAFVTSAHKEDLAMLGAFADRGSNLLHVVPGNHDAALLLDEPWRITAAALGARPGRVIRHASGLWRSSDGRVVVEHGHQIGDDVNRYPTWPAIRRQEAAVWYVERPWGERFVQKLFNEQEARYPVVDNLSPESAGVRHRMADRGLWASVQDVAEFLRFNLLETSAPQRASFLGKDPSGSDPEWDDATARALGDRLFLDALPADDAFRTVALGPSPEAAELRRALGQLAADKTRLPEAEVSALCAQLAASPNPGKCVKPALGHVVEGMLIPRREVLARHLRGRLKEPGMAEMRVFVYAHTHELEPPWSVRPTDVREVSVLNTGAFQRVIGDPEFLRLSAAKGLQPGEALRTLSVDDLGACYTAVLVAVGAPIPPANTLRWAMHEAGGGRFVLPGDPDCLPAALKIGRR